MNNIRTNKDIIKRLKTKANSYNNQDKQKGRLVYNNTYDSYNKPPLIHTDIFDIIETQTLECYYCADMTNIIPKKKYDPNQTTLDRIDNS